MSSSLWASVADMSARCKPQVQLFDDATMDGRCGIISSCQSAATSEIVKVLLVASLTHVRDAMASTRPLL